MKIRLSLLVVTLGLLSACADNAGMRQAMSAYYSGNYPSAFEKLNELAAQGSPGAARQLGYMYEYGYGVPQDYAAAKDWFLKAAKYNDAAAQLELGYLYDKGLGVPQDFGRAHDWYLKSAHVGWARAKNNLGYQYLHGEGVTKDPEQALEWFHEAASDGDDLAAANLGYMYFNGEGVDKDIAKAMEWYRASARLGNLECQMFMAQVYMNGSYGVPKDGSLARQMFDLASKRQITSAAEGQDAMRLIIDAHKTYPAEAIKAKTKGVVSLSFDCFDQRPKNVHVDVSSGSSLLDAAAMSSVEDSIFPRLSPKLMGATHYIVAIDFEIDQPSVAAPAATTAK